MTEQIKAASRNAHLGIEEKYSSTKVLLMRPQHKKFTLKLT
jgi:hypothetical protein